MSELRASLRRFDLGETSALLVIDMQNDFAGPFGRLYVDGSDAVVPAIQRLLELWRDAGLPIFHVIRLYLADLSNVEPCRKSRLAELGGAALPGSHGAEIVVELLPRNASPPASEALLGGAIPALGPNEWCVYKSRWGAFYQTSLHDRLIDLGVDGIVLCGCNLPNCPRATAFEASERDFPTAIVADATSQSTAGRLWDLKLIGVGVLAVDDLCPPV